MSNPSLGLESKFFFFFFFSKGLYDPLKSWEFLGHCLGQRHRWNRSKDTSCKKKKNKIQLTKFPLSCFGISYLWPGGLVLQKKTCLLVWRFNLYSQTAIAGHVNNITTQQFQNHLFWKLFEEYSGTSIKRQVLSWFFQNEDKSPLTGCPDLEPVLPLLLCCQVRQHQAIPFPPHKHLCWIRREVSPHSEPHAGPAPLHPRQTSWAGASLDILGLLTTLQFYQLQPVPSFFFVLFSNHLSCACLPPRIPTPAQHGSVLSKLPLYT